MYLFFLFSNIDFYHHDFLVLYHKVSKFQFKLKWPFSVYSGQEALINAMNDELPRIQEQVYYGQINSRTDVLDKLLSENGVSRYNPQVKLLRFFLEYHIYIMILLLLYVCSNMILVGCRLLLMARSNQGLYL